MGWRFLITTGWAALSWVAAPASADAAAAPAEKTHCQMGETVVLSCQVTGRKIVSLCSSGPATAPQLAYRFGTGRRIELVYPAPGNAGAFYRTSAPLIGGGIATVGFSRGGYDYSVYAKSSQPGGAAGGGGGDPEFEDGLIVSRGGKRLRTLVCADGGAGFRQSIDWLPRKAAN